MVFLPKEMLCKLYLTSFRFRNLRHGTQKDLVTDPQISIPSCAPPGDAAGKTRRWGGQEYSTGQAGAVVHLQNRAIIVSTELSVSLK